MNDENLPGVSATDHILTAGGMTAPLAHVAAVTVVGALYPRYNHLSKAMSALGAQAALFRAIFGSGALLARALAITFSVAMCRQLKSRSFCLTTAALTTIGVGRIFSVVFPCDPRKNSFSTSITASCFLVSYIFLDRCV